MGYYVPIGQYAPQERYLIFFDDGTFFHDMPFAGLNGFDREESKAHEAEKDSWGTYSMEGNSGTLILNRSPLAMELTMESEDKFMLGSEPYYRTKEVDGLILDGAWSLSGDPEYSNIEVDGLKWIIRFTPDGKFQDEGLMTGFFDYGPAEAKGGAGEGTYKIEDYTLRLTYDDGRIRSAAFSLFLSHDRKSTPEIIFIHRTAIHLLGD